MIGEYVNTGRGMNVTISPAVPGAQYRITAWALGNNGSRNISPAVKNVTAGEACELVGYSVNLSIKGFVYHLSICNQECMLKRVGPGSIYTV